MAQTFSVLHTFRMNGDGAGPYGGLVSSADTLYGITAEPKSGSGTIFSVSAEGTFFTNLHNFGSDGNTPMARMVLSGNTLYGTTLGGGWGEGDNYGTVFKVDTDGTEFTNLYIFSALSPPFGFGGTNSDGAYPWASLILSDGTLYGVASAGGRFGNGTVFAVNTDGTGFTNLFDFLGGTNGTAPMGGLIRSGSTLYGTTAGDSPQGTVFTLQADGTHFSTLYGFASGGSTAALVLSGDTLYGTTYDDGDSGNGSVFSVKTNGSGFKTLHSFSSFTQDFDFNPDGAYPQSKLVLSGTTLYGTAESGGPSGSGVVFALNIDGTGFTNLYSFTATSINPADPTHGFYDTNSDGAYPHGELILSADTLYGTTRRGGLGGMGTVFSLWFTPQLSLTSSGSNIVLSWPTNYAGFDYSGYTLQSATDLNSPIWTTNLPAPVVVNGQNTVTNPISGTQQFFRLSQ
jgi:uncharacterized repeat protein (TIGR03803 family)